MPSFGISGTFGVAVARHGLILWENGATSLRIIFKGLPGLRDTIKKIKIAKIYKNTENSDFPVFSRIFWICALLNIPGPVARMGYCILGCDGI